MKKFALIVMAVSFILCITGCGATSTETESFKPLEGSIAQKISSTYEKTDNKEQQLYDIWTIIDKEREAGEWFLYDDEETTAWILSTSSGGECNPYKEVLYDYGDEEKWLEYRFVCQKDVNLFDENIIIEDVRRIMGVDLNQTDFSIIAEDLKNRIDEIENQQTIKLSVINFDNMDVVVSIAKMDDIIAMAIHCGYTA